MDCVLGGGESKQGAVKRTFAKLGHKHHAQEDDEEAERNQHQKTEDYTSSVAYALVREIFDYLNSEGGQIAIKSLIVTQAKVAAEVAVSEAAKEASRVAVQEAFNGSYDAAELRYLDKWAKLPSIVKLTVLPLLLSYIAVFGLGLLLCLWRFALLGIH